MTYEDFEKFDKENPQIWQMFVRFTNEAINAGRKRFSAEVVINRLRWESQVAAKNDEFKINNDLKPFYARKFMQLFPQYDGFFETRKQRHEKSLEPVKCEKCEGQIVFLTHKTTGNVAAIDAEPNQYGNLLVKDGLYRVATTEEIKRAREINHPLYINHNAICEKEGK